MNITTSTCVKGMEYYPIPQDAENGAGWKIVLENKFICEYPLLQPKMLWDGTSPKLIGNYRNDESRKISKPLLKTVLDGILLKTIRNIGTDHEQTKGQHQDRVGWKSC